MLLVPLNLAKTTALYLAMRSTFFPVVTAPLHASQHLSSFMVSSFGFLLSSDAPGTDMKCCCAGPACAIATHYLLSVQGTTFAAAVLPIIFAIVRMSNRANYNEKTSQSVFACKYTRQICSQCQEFSIHFQWSAHIA